MLVRPVVDDLVRAEVEAGDRVPLGVPEHDVEARPDDPGQPHVLLGRRGTVSRAEQRGTERRDGNAVALSSPGPTRSLPERIAGRLPTELGLELLGERGDDPGPELRSVLVGERPLRGLEREVERDRLPPRADLLASVDVEHANVAQRARHASLAASTGAPTSTSSSTATAMSWRTAG